MTLVINFCLVLAVALSLQACHCVLEHPLLQPVQRLPDSLSLESVLQNGSSVSSPIRLKGDQPSSELSLCDCEYAVGPPGGLSCEREGWFISNFERQGSWEGGMGWVPVSKAICCRPCLPESLPESVSNALEAEEKPLAVCCTPSLLLSTGSAWQLERCECEWSPNINCGEKGSGRLLAGFFTGRGVCVMGACECRAGWKGADCSLQVGGHRGLSGTIIALIVVCSAVGFVTLLTTINAFIRCVSERGAEEERDEEEGTGVNAPLLLRIAEDDEGSVGSDDTSDWGDRSDVELEGPAGEGQQRREPLGGGEYSEDPAPPADGLRSAGAQEAASGGRDSAGEQSPQQEPQQEQEQEQAARQPREAVPAAAASVGEIEVMPTGEDEQLDQQARDDSPRQGFNVEGPQLGTPDSKGKDGVEPWGGGLTGVALSADCSVCMNRPVQVVVIPCGHACMCRRCSRRLARCPVCRREVARRQRLFIGG
ncbi:hypothetical protein WJX73_009962 [Symbiochloris irregularis]|uniref:RING-type domain-containing protein n=1 Tax=Symbiochloris irregularis TaxID=706552 RepID=A0AAW1NYH1_9CHLO